MKIKMTKSVKVGVFAVAIIVLLYMGINFIKGSKIFSNDYKYYAEYEQADGIEVSSPVLIKGFKVGMVEKISFDIQKSTIVVQMSVSQKYPIPRDSRAKITSTGLLGGKIIDISLGQSSDTYEDGDHLISYSEPGLFDVVGEEFEKLKGQAGSLVDKLSGILDGVNGIVSKENQANISGTLASLNAMTTDIEHLVNKQKSNVESMIANMNAISTSLTKQMPKLGATLDNLETVSGTFATKAPELLTNASTAISKLNDMMAKIDAGQGTLGKLVNDEQMYDNLNQATQALTLLLEDLKANPKRYVRFSVFGGGKKSK